MKNSQVRVLNTYLNMDIVEQRYNETKRKLKTLADTQPIYCIRCDKPTRNWFRTYGQLCEAQRCINKSRILRRMCVTGFRIVHLTTQKISSDTLIVGTNEMAIILRSMLTTFTTAERIVFSVHITSKKILPKYIPDLLREQPEWSAKWYIVEDRTDGKSGVFTITARTEQIANIIGMLSERFALRLDKITFRMNTNLYVYAEKNIPNDMRERYQFNDINVALDGRQVKRFQTFGLLHQTKKTI